VHFVYSIISLSALVLPSRLDMYGCSWKVVNIGAVADSA
jgi:hypothetical protein